MHRQLWQDFMCVHAQAVKSGLYVCTGSYGRTLCVYMQTEEVGKLQAQVRQQTRLAEEAQVSRGETINQLTRSLEESQHRCQVLLDACEVASYFTFSSPQFLMYISQLLTSLSVLLSS